MQARERLTVYVRLDDFYAATEQRLVPGLRGRPVIVGPELVLGCSAEARARGVRPGMSTGRARRRCPEALVVRGHRAAWEALAAGVWSCCQGFTTVLETYATEAYGAAAGLGYVHGPARLLGQRLAGTIRRRTGVAATVGLGRNRLLAWAAAQSVEPGGIGLVGPLAEERAVAQLPLAGLPGLGAVEAARLRELNITRLGQVRGWARGQLRALLPESGELLFERCRGLDRETVDRAARPTRLEAGHEWAVPEGASARLQGELWQLVEQLGQRLHERGLAAGRLELSVAYGDGQAVPGQVRLAAATAMPGELGAAAAGLLERLLQRRVAVRGLRVAALALAAPGPLLAAELAAPGDGVERLRETVEGLRRRFGRAAIVTGPGIELLARPAGGGS